MHLAFRMPAKDSDCNKYIHLFHLLVASKSTVFEACVCQSANLFDFLVELYAPLTEAYH